MKLIQASTIVVTIIIALISGGCFQSRPEDIQAFARPHRVPVTQENYILSPPDEIEIRSSKVAEIDLQSQIIRPDGMVSFEGIGEIRAAGRTPKELADALREKVSELYTLSGDHPIDVQITAYESKFYYVVGEVFFEGPKAATGRDPLIAAVARARPTTMAWKSKIQVVRPSYDPEGERARIFEFDYNALVRHGDASKNVLLEEGDVVYVPPTILAAIGLKMEEFLRPIGRAFSTVNIMNSGTRY